MKMLALLLPLLLIIGCASAPPKFNVNPVATISGDFDSVWSAVVEYFAIGNLPIKTIEKDSGLIVTEWMDASKNGIEEDRTYCHCGGSGLFSRLWTRGKFSVFVKRAGDNQVSLRVTCTFQQKREFASTYTTVNCNSTGYLENQIKEYVIAKIQEEPLPQVPSFKPGSGD